MMKTALLSTAYFGPVQWFQKVNRYDLAIVDERESFLKQTYRNRCIIATGRRQVLVPAGTVVGTVFRWGKDQRKE